MEVDIYDANSLDEEALVRVLVSLTIGDLIKQIKQGEVLATRWLESRLVDAEFRIIVQGRRVGAGKGGEIIDLQEGERRIITP